MLLQNFFYNLTIYIHLELGPIDLGPRVVAPFCPTLRADTGLLQPSLAFSTARSDSDRSGIPLPQHCLFCPSIWLCLHTLVFTSIPMYVL